MEMFVFFTIPWIFVIALVVIALGIGVSALQFILDHIIIISIILGLPVAWLVWGTWKNENSSDEEKVGWTLYLLFLVPAYAELIRLIVTVLNALDNNDLWAFFLYFPTAPVVFLIILAVCMGVAAGLVWLYKKVIKSKVVTIVFGILIASSMTYYLWNLS
jgi:hypothetical protein